MNVSSRLSDVIRQILNAESESFLDLVKVANLDPAKDFRGAMLRGVDFADCDLTGFDFSHAQLVECGFRGAVLGNARFENTAIRLTDVSRAVDWSTRRSSSNTSLRVWSPDSDDDTSPEERRVIGRIVSTNDEIAIVDFGHGLCRRIHRSLIETILESRSSDVGDTVSIPQEVVDTANPYFVDTDEIAASLDFDSIVQAHEKQEIVRGFIQRPIRGGFLVNVGGFKAFLPGSLLDRSKRKDVAGLLDDPQPFLVIQVGSRSPDDLIVSRIAAIEKAEEELITEQIELLPLGSVHNGKISSVQDYGVFVDINGIDGLCHISDLSWSKNINVRATYKRGDIIEVSVKSINVKKRRISLDHKSLAPDPWIDAEVKFKPGTRYRGTVESIVKYGVFVRIIDGVTGLLHESLMNWSPQRIVDKKINVLSLGNEIDVVIEYLDRDKKRIGLRFESDNSSATDQFLMLNPPGSSFVYKGGIWNERQLNCDLGSGVLGVATLPRDQDNFAPTESVNLVVLGQDDDSDRILLAIHEPTNDLPPQTETICRT